MLSESTKSINSLHFIGIAGSGMCPLAVIAKSRGFKVSGSDLGSGRNHILLKKMGITLYQDHKAQNAMAADALVISTAIKDNNPELQWAQKNNIPVYHRSELLAELATPYHLITVAGTHGKTTTAAMLAYLLDIHKQDPMVVVGGHMHHFDASWHIGSGKYFIAEADESDGSFLSYRPATGVLNNIDKDHLDHYGDFRQVKKAFNQYLCNITSDGSAIISTDDKHSLEAFHTFHGKKISYGGSESSDFRVSSLKTEGKYVKFSLEHQSKAFQCKLKSIGVHNVANALAAVVTAYSIGLPIQKSLDALKHFPGVARRLSIISESPSLKIIDDYAHNPGKISASIQAVGEAFPDHDVFVIFEPHRFSRLDTMYNEFIHSFTKASQVYVTPIFSAGEEPNDRYNPGSIATDIERASSVDSFPYVSEEQVLNSISQGKQNKLVVLTVGAGDSSKIAFSIKRCSIANQENKLTEGAPAQPEAKKTE